MGNIGRPDSVFKTRYLVLGTVTLVPVLLALATLESDLEGGVLKGVVLPTLAIGSFLGLYTRTTLSRYSKSVFAALAFLWIGLFDLVSGLIVLVDEDSAAGSQSSLRFYALMLMAGLLFISSWEKQLKKLHQISKLPVVLGLVAVAAIGLAVVLPSFWPSLSQSAWIASTCSVLAPIFFLWGGYRRAVEGREVGRPVAAGLAISGLAGTLVVAIGAGWLNWVGLTPRQQSFAMTLLVAPPLIGILIEDLQRFRRSMHSRIRITMLGLLGLLLALCLILSATFSAEAFAKALDKSAVAQSQLIIVVILLTTTAAVFLVTTANRDLIRRISDLSRTTMAFAGGQKDVRVEVYGDDEIDKLGLAFNSLAERVTAQNDELQLLARVMEGTSEAIAVIDDKHRIAFVNAACTQIVGWSRTEMVGRHFDRFFRNTLNDEAATDIWKGLQDRGRWNGDLFIRRREGDPIEFSLTVNEVTHRKRCFVAVFRDLRVVREMEHERTVYMRHLIKIGRLTRLMVESLSSEEIQAIAVDHLKEDFGADSRIWMLEAEDGSKQRVLTLAASSIEVVPNADSPPRSGLAQRVMTEGEPIICIEPNQHESIFADATEDSCYLGPQAAFPLEVGGQLEGVLELSLPDQGHQRSVDAFLLLAHILSGTLSHAALYRQTSLQSSVLKQLGKDRERAMQRIEMKSIELESANTKLVESGRTKDLFLSTASHELRTPVSSVLGFLKLILDGLASDPEEEMQFIREAHGCAEHLLALINDILDAARMDAGRFDMVRSDVNVATVLAEVRRLSGAKTQDKGLEFVVKVKPGLICFADEHRLKQAFVNLVGNSIKFTESGSITITAIEDLDAGHVSFAVRDTGIGMSENDCSKVLEAFVQADAGDTRAYGGSGLGLSITKQLISLMGGSLHLESEGVGKGTVACFSLPLARKRLNPIWIPPLPDGTPRGRAMLVGHDLEFWRDAAIAFADAGYAVAVVETADQAYERAHLVLPDVIVSGFTLIHESDALFETGIDLAKAIIDDERMNGCEFYMVTASDASSGVLGKKAARLRDLNFLSRPLNPTELPMLLGYVIQEPKA